MRRRFDKQPSGMRVVLTTGGFVSLAGVALSLVGGCLPSLHGAAERPCNDEHAIRDPKTLRCMCGPGTHNVDDLYCEVDEQGSDSAVEIDAESVVDADDGAIVDGSVPDDATVVDAENDARVLDADQIADAEPDAGSPETDPDAGDARVPQFWYRDCDGDGYAASRVGRASGSQKPASPADCFDWTTLEPASTNETDCDDANEYRHPGAGPGLPFIAGKLPEAGSLAYDLDCDGTAEASGDFFSTGVIRAGKLEVFGGCLTDPVCPEAKKCMVSFAFPETPLCGAQYPADVALDDVRCTQSIPVYFLCQ